MQAAEPLTISASIVVLAAVGAIARLVPACRAASVNPAVALRDE